MELLKSQSLKSRPTDSIGKIAANVRFAAISFCSYSDNNHIKKKGTRMSLLSMQGITKAFPGVLALDHIDLDVEEGEIHALLGENGAGKTTLMNILYGLYRQDGGQIFWEGQPVDISKPDEAIAIRIGMVHQHFMLVRKMTGLENILLGLRLPGYPVMHKEQQIGKIEELCTRYGLSVDLHKRVDRMAVGEQQRVEILKALFRDAKLLILDEPTSVLTTQETQEFFSILRSLAAEGHSIILIAHNLSEVMGISDRITVLRDGKKVCTVHTKDTDEVALSRYMIGRDFEECSHERKPTDQSTQVFEIKELSLQSGNRALLDHISLYIRSGEILGIAGVDGNGQTELAEVLTGIRKQTSGEIYLNSKPIHNLGVRKRWEKGISYIPSDRHRDGVIMDATVAENTAVHTYYHDPYSQKGILRFQAIHAKAQSLTHEYQVRTPDTKTKIRLLSGGNQQKLLLARELQSEGSLIIACQPTRGLDIGATEFLRQQLMNRRNAGKSVLLISTDLREILALSDRIAVIHGGKIMGVVDNNEMLTVELLGLMMGGKMLSEVTHA